MNSPWIAYPAEDLVTLAVTGADRTTWLNGLVTRDLTTLKPGSAVYGLAVGKKGRIIADLVIAARADDLVLAVSRGGAAELRATFEHHLVMEDAELADAGLDAWRLVGPRARDVSLAAPCFVAPLDWDGSGGAVAFVPRGSPAIAEAAAAGGGVVGDAAAWEAARIARGVPRFGADFDASTYPQEASLEKRAVSFDKGCYLGQEVVCMLELRGQVQRKLVPLALDGPAPVGALVRDAAGAEVGRLTSVTATHDGALGLAMVKRASAAPGTELAVDGARGRVSA